MTAVPAHIPNPWSPIPIRCPSAGKMKTAAMLKRNIVDMEWAISSSFAPITGAVAAIADPPQMAVPTPIRVAVTESSRRTLCMAQAERNAAVRVKAITTRDSLPTARTFLMFISNPSRTTESWSSLFEAKRVPSLSAGELTNRATIIPKRMPNTGAPTMGTRCPQNHASTARMTVRSSPGTRPFHR